MNKLPNKDVFGRPIVSGYGGFFIVFLLWVGFFVLMFLIASCSKKHLTPAWMDLSINTKSFNFSRVSGETVRYYTNNNSLVVEVHEDYVKLFSLIRLNNSLEFSTNLIHWTKLIPNLNEFSDGMEFRGYDRIFMRYGLPE